MDVSSVGKTQDTGAAIQKATKDLGKDEFLKLLLTELKYQDAMDPVKDKDFIAQMAQFSSLEQTTNMSNSLKDFAGSTAKNQALSMFGLPVKAYKEDTGQEVSGIVSTIDLSGVQPKLSILMENEQVMRVNLSEVIEVGIQAE